MPLRRAHKGDLSAIASIYAAAFWDESFVGKIMHPNRQVFPEDYRRYWQHKVAEWYWSYSHQLLVTYTIQQTEQGMSEENLTGVADWIRHGEGWSNLWQVHGNWDPRNMITKLVAMRNRVASFWCPNRAMDPSTISMETEVFSFISHLWSGPRATGWYLNYLAVDPVYQNQGYGSSLVLWGMERAKIENVAASVISGDGKDNFYRRCGFEIELERATDGDGNPLKGRVEGGAVLFRDAMIEENYGDGSRLKAE